MLSKYYEHAAWLDGARQWCPFLFCKVYDEEWLIYQGFNNPWELLGYLIFF